MSKSQDLFGAREDLLAYEMAAVENIDTVDKFQGSERQVVISSTCVDTKPLWAADPLFINVACSRSKHLLVVVGNFSHGLAVNKDWCYILQQSRLNSSSVDHRITETEGQDGEISRDLHEHDFNSKLHDLLARPSHRRKPFKTEDAWLHKLPMLPLLACWDINLIEEIKTIGNILEMRRTLI